MQFTVVGHLNNLTDLQAGNLNIQNRACYSSELELLLNSFQIRDRFITLRKKKRSTYGKYCTDWQVALKRYGQRKLSVGALFSIDVRLPAVKLVMWRISSPELNFTNQE